MLNNQMSLKEIIEFKPDDNQMLNLDLDIVVYLKVTIVSYAKEDNYNFIKYLFKDEEVPSYFKNYEKTIFYDYDGSNTAQERIVTVFELYSLMNYASVSIYLEELLEKYSHEADVVIDFFTHDNKTYRLSDIDAIVKLEELHI